MKKALLTVLIVLLSVTAVFANYGLDFSGKFVSKSIKANEGFTLSTSLKPYVAEGNYKVQLRFNWEANGSGFTQFKIDNKNVLTITSSIFAFVDNAYLQIGNSTLGLTRDTYDTPYFYFEGQVGRFAYDFNADVSFPVDLDEYAYTIPVEANIEYVYSDSFPFTVGTDTTGALLISEAGKGYNVKPNLYMNVPVVINNHEFKIGYSFTTEMQNSPVKVIKPFETIEVESSIETTWGIYNAKDTINVEKTSQALNLTLTADKKLTLGDGAVTFKAVAPFVISGGFGVVMDENDSDLSADYIQLKYDYKKAWFSFGASAKAKGLFAAKAVGLTATELLNYGTKFVSTSAYVAFDTIPFDLKLVLTPVSYFPFDATFGVQFNVNVENYLSQEN